MGRKKNLMEKKALIVVTNHSDFEHPKADPTGLWLSELTHFYDEFEKAGIAMDIVSLEGGKIPIDSRSLGRFTLDKASRRRHEDPAFMASTGPLTESGATARKPRPPMARSRSVPRRPRSARGASQPNRW